MELNKYSKHVTQDETQPAAQAMLYGVGLTEEDMKKAQVGIVSTWWEGNTCNMHLNDLAKVVKEGVANVDLVCEVPAGKVPPGIGSWLRTSG